ncbi:hypothetical protein [Vibrio sp. Isolate31]
MLPYKDILNTEKSSVTFRNLDSTSKKQKNAHLIYD